MGHCRHRFAPQVRDFIRSLTGDHRELGDSPGLGPSSDAHSRHEAIQAPFSDVGDGTETLRRDLASFKSELHFLAQTNEYLEEQLRSAKQELADKATEIDRLKTHNQQLMTMGQAQQLRMAAEMQNLEEQVTLLAKVQQERDSFRTQLDELRQQMKENRRLSERSKLDEETNDRSLAEARLSSAQVLEIRDLRQTNETLQKELSRSTDESVRLHERVRKLESDMVSQRLAQAQAKAREAVSPESVRPIHAEVPSLGADVGERALVQTRASPYKRGLSPPRRCGGAAIPAQMLTHMPHRTPCGRIPFGLL